ncbi:MAG: helix-turn-helix domain-containing protein [Planctomycetes bacterium]|nr:helix-turn-helix domain-containing protein [Planctomycetota bacterium]MBL7205582.1 helix-turn-helix domain-containing protein [Desulfobacteraceae bacterium]
MSVDSLENIFGGAVGLAVEELLNDDEILVYLGSPKKTPAPSSEKGMESPRGKPEKENRKAWSVAEVAESFGVPESTVRRWIVDRQLRATKLGSTWLIPNSEVEKISNPSKRTSSKKGLSSKETESPQPDPGEWLRKLRHLKAIGLLSQEEYAEEEAKLRKAGRY